jgi:NDP-sugar pyrophosphorylase family protein
LRAVILAGGKGTRLLPYTHLIPKPLVPIGDRYSILEIIILQLVQCGFQHITLTVNHLAHLIESYFGNGERFGIKIDYSIEEKPLGTIGPLTLINDLPDNFLVMNGDILTDMNYLSFYKKHCDKNASISVASKTRQVKLDFGVIECDEEHKLTGFKEKPIYTYDVSMGIYCIRKDVIMGLKKNSFYGFDTLMQDSLSICRKVCIDPYQGYWLDIGRPEDYESANKDFKAIYERLNV